MGKKKIKIRKKDYADVMCLLVTADKKLALAKREIQSQQKEIDSLKNSLEHSQSVIKRIAVASNIYGFKSNDEYSNLMVTYQSGDVQCVNIDLSSEAIVREAIFESIIKHIYGQIEYEKLIKQIGLITKSHKDQINDILDFLAKKTQLND